MVKSHPANHAIPMKECGSIRIFRILLSGRIRSQDSLRGVLLQRGTLLRKIVSAEPHPSKSIRT